MRDSFFKTKVLEYLPTFDNLATDVANNGTAVTSLLTIIQGVLNDVSAGTSGASTIGHISNDTISNAAATRIDATSNNCVSCTVTADIANTGYLKIGGSSLTASDGIVLHAGESYDFNISNSNLLYAWAEVNGEDVSATYYN